MFTPKSKTQDVKAPSPAQPAALPTPATPAAESIRRDARPENYLSPGTVIEGNIVSSEVLRLDGKVKGDVRTTARLYLGPESVIEGNITAVDAEVAGKILGTIECRGQLTIKATCVIDGDIVTRSLNVESGSSFNGRCKVGEAVPAPAASDEKLLKNRVKSQTLPAVELAIN